MAILYAIEQNLCKTRKPRWERAAIPLAALSAIALVTLVFWWGGWRINWTESEPLGLYRLRAVQEATKIPRGTLAEFCPPASVTPQAFPFYMKGDCPGGGMPMFKQIVGIPGDRVTVTPQSVSINGKPLPHSGQLEDSSSYPWVRLPHQVGAFVLGPNQYWVYGSGARPDLAAQSFDSRYWGAISRQNILAIALP